MTDMLPIGQCVRLACLMEVSAPKPGNVHRGADFENLSFFDFAASAVAIGPVFDRLDAADSPSHFRRLGQLIFKSVQATRDAAATNTNLGTVLLLAPLALVPQDVSLGEGIGNVLGSLNADDCRDVYAAIGLAQPGGMGKVDEADLADAPPSDLIEAMRLAADRDLVARQYVNNFAEVLGEVLPAIGEGLTRGWSLSDTIVRVHVQLMRDHPDSLITRKCGPDVARESAAYAGQVLDAGLPGDEEYENALADLDFWLRSDGHRRNPGTTADLVAAGLFAALREGIIKAPFRFYRAS
jgi:triphosphoribosyl-dephospho-CoA synthase